MQSKHRWELRQYAQYDPNNCYEKKNTTIDFPIQPSITKVCRAIRSESLPIFYGANSCEVSDLYWPTEEGVQMPFPNFVSRWLIRIKPHISFIRNLEITCGEGTAQCAHEMVSFLVDHFNFRGVAVTAVDWD